MKNSGPASLTARSATLKPRQYSFFNLLLIVALSVTQCGAFAKARPSADKNVVVEGRSPIRSAEIIVGPFDLHRRYKSMEGPYVQEKFTIGDLLATKQVTVPETDVVFIEGNSGSGPSMSAASSSASLSKGLVNTSGQKRELYWFKGIKLEVLDEDGNVMPTAEFICHLNLDVEPTFRNAAFPEGERCHNSRLLTLTQGQTELVVPEGFGVPVASDEPWLLTFQAANRTTDDHRRLRHRCTISYVKDSDLMYPIKSLSWYAPYVAVVVDKDTDEARESEHKNMPDCLGTSVGVTAPNSVPGSILTDTLQRKLSGHWVVPPGAHTYTAPIVEARDPGFGSKDRLVHLVWSHVHPLCTTASLVQCGPKKKALLTSHCKTDVSKGLQIQNIETITSKEGILIPKNRPYEVEAVYNNVTETPQDSMVVLGIFFEDNSFARPDWFLQDKNEAYCGVTSGGACAAKDSTVATAQTTSDTKDMPAKSPTDYMPPYQLFNDATDGPLLKEKKTLELETSAGKIMVELDPALAPIHATQLYKLFKAGAFDGTEIFRHEPGFVLQIGQAEAKSRTAPMLTAQQRDLLRRLPLEVASQDAGSIKHKKGCLSMAHYDDKDTGVSSFSIMLGDAPHLDGEYTIFGRVLDDQATTQTLKNITDNWNKDKLPFIIKAKG